MPAIIEQGDSSRMAARLALRRRGIGFEEQRGLEYVRKGDVETVGLFLAAGLDPNFSDGDGVPAIVVAARGRHESVCRLLIEHGAHADRLVEALHDPHRPVKDLWERIAATGGVLTFVSSLVIAGVGWHFTNAYNERQQLNAVHLAERDAEIRRQQTRIAEMDTVVKMIPHLTQGEQSKRAALLALSALATPELAVQMAQLFGGVGSVQALQTIAAESPASSKSGAVSALAGIASRPADGQAEAANAASAALEGIFKGKERALVTILSRGQFACNGFVAELNGPVIVTPAYCFLDDWRPADFTVKMWDKKQMPVLGLVRHGPVATVTVTDVTSAARLSLAESIPPAGSRVLKLAYVQDVTRGSVQESPRISVATGIVEGMTTTPAPETGSQGNRDVLKVRFSDSKETAHGGEAGGPILDAAGAAACMVYLATAQGGGVEWCLPSAAIRQLLSPVRTSSN